MVDKAEFVEMDVVAQASGSNRVVESQAGSSIPLLKDSRDAKSHQCTHWGGGGGTTCHRNVMLDVGAMPAHW